MKINLFGGVMAIWQQRQQRRAAHHAHILHSRCLCLRSAHRTWRSEPEVIGGISCEILW